MSFVGRLRLVTASICAVLGAVLATQAAPATAANLPVIFGDIFGISDHFVYTQTNDSPNAVVGFRRDQFGNLTPVPGSPFATRGSGVFNPAGVLGPFDADQQVAIDRDRFLLFAVNAGSNTIAVFHIVQGLGSLVPVQGSPFPSGGINPISIGLRGDQVVIINQNQNQADPASFNRQTSNIVTRHIALDGSLVELADDTTLDLPQGSSPSQALTTNTGAFVFDPEFAPPAQAPGKPPLPVGALASYSLSPTGALTPTPANNPPAAFTSTASPGVLIASPLGSWANPVARELYVGVTGQSALAAFTWDAEGNPSFQNLVPLTGKAVCWVRVNHAGTRVYTSNTGSHTIDTLDIVSDPALPIDLSNSAAIGGPQGTATLMMEVDPTDAFVFVISQSNAVGGSATTRPTTRATIPNELHVMQVSPDGNSLTEVGTGTPIPTINPAAKIHGVAVF
jgi:hypothetical protein